MMSSPYPPGLLRTLGGVLAAGLLVLAVPAVHPARAQPDAPKSARSVGAPSVEAVASVGITVSDLDQALEFYTGVLPFQIVGQTETWGADFEHLTGVFGARARIARLQLGDEFIELMEYLAPEGRPIPADSRSNDRWFQHIAIVVPDIERAYKHLREHKVRHASSGPQTLPDWNLDAGGISAFYFKDPDGHVLEVICFPPGKGDPRWQQPTDRLFLGIDHTAIVVADTDLSLAFYRDTLGMAVVGGAENHGVEQEHLNNVFGARLRITALKAASGPGVELLEYLAPTTGRDYPADAGLNDLIGWRTTLLTSEPVELTERLRVSHARWVSPGLVSVTDGADGPGLAATVRDPDGHAIELRQLPATTAASPAAAAGR